MSGNKVYRPLTQMRNEPHTGVHPTINWKGSNNMKLLVSIALRAQDDDDSRSDTIPIYEQMKAIHTYTALDREECPRTLSFPLTHPRDFKMVLREYKWYINFRLILPKTSVELSDIGCLANSLVAQGWCSHIGIQRAMRTSETMPKTLNTSPPPASAAQVLMNVENA